VSRRRVIPSVRMRLTLWYVLLLVLVLALFGGSLYVGLSRALYQSIDDALQRNASVLSGTLEAQADEKQAAPSAVAGSRNDMAQGEYFWRVLDPSGRTVRQSGLDGWGGLGVNPHDLTASISEQEVFRTLHFGDKWIRLYSVAMDYSGNPAILQFGVSLDDMRDTLDAFGWIALVLFGGTVIVAVAGGLFLAGSALRPVDEITQAARSITAQDLSRRLELKLPDDEIGRLARTFNQMIARLEQAFRRQRRFAADASHELRTPLTIMKGDLGVALRRARSSAYYRRVLTEIDEEVDRMDRLVGKLLLLARADVGQLKLAPRLGELSPMLTELCRQFRPMAAAKGLELSTEIDEGLAIVVDSDVLTQVVVNLLENAIKYTERGRVELAAHRAKGARAEVAIAVSDTGPGIEEQHIPHLFERFYRIDKARSRARGGTGLGLSIAHELVLALGGTLSVTSHPGQGSTFTVALPSEAVAASP
jgi:heavy metal sensor kinase